MTGLWGFPGLGHFRSDVFVDLALGYLPGQFHCVKIVLVLGSMQGRVR